MRRATSICATFLLAAATLSAASDAGEEQPFGKPLFEGGGIAIYQKVDFDAGANPFQAEGSGGAALDDRPEHALCGRSLRVWRAEPEGYFGARAAEAIAGSKGLKIAFCVRSKGMLRLAVNLFDALRDDNTTPVSPAALTDDTWLPVVFAVEDFYYNGGQPEDRVDPATKYTRLLFHGLEAARASGEFWIDNLVIYRGDDSEPPGAPPDVTGTALADGRVALTWDRASDNAFAVVYSIHRKRGGGPWEKVGESLEISYLDPVPAPGAYTYRITAADYENNVSPPSREVPVAVTSAGHLSAAADERVTDRLRYADAIREIRARGAGKVRRDVFLFFGDSITAANVYTYALGSALGRGRTVRQGYGQMTTAFAKARIDEFLAAANPEFAIVMFGTNDAKDPENVRRAMENLAYAIDACARRGTIPILATIPPRGYELEQTGERRYNAALIALCRQKKIPISYVFEEMIGQDLRSLLGDGVHLTPGPGNEAAGAALRKTFDQISFALRDVRV
jgi:hypothetical protein